MSGSASNPTESTLISVVGIAKGVSSHVVPSLTRVLLIVRLIKSSPSEPPPSTIIGVAAIPVKSDSCISIIPPPPPATLNSAVGDPLRTVQLNSFAVVANTL